MSKEMIKVPKELIKLIHKMANRIKNSHGGWYESYASSDEIKLVKFSEELKNV